MLWVLETRTSKYTMEWILAIILLIIIIVVPLVMFPQIFTCMLTVLGYQASDSSKTGGVQNKQTNQFKNCKSELTLCAYHRD